MSSMFQFCNAWSRRLPGRVALWTAVMVVMANVTAVMADEQHPLMRFPDVHGNTVVFVHGEDIWSAPTTGGVAQRLTIHDGEERFPKFSPDGSLIAFTGEYDGNPDVYVMNSDGGQITRLTYHPGYDEVVGWHPLKNKILFRSTRHSFEGFYRLFLIAPDGTGLEELILHEGAAGSFSPDGTQIAFNRIGRERRTWKRYRGGTAQEVLIYDFTTHELRNISNFAGTDRIPMWIGDKIYFSSDRDRVLNIYAYDTNTGQIAQVTRHTDYDVRRPSMGGKNVVYELGGALWLLDVETGQTGQIPVEIRADAPEVRPYLRRVDSLVTGFDCSPTGKRAVIVARGEVFTVPREDGPTRNLTQSAGSREKDAVWSPNGKTIAYLSDKSGEYEIYLVDAQGRTEAVRLTQHQDGYRHSLKWSPDSKKIAFADQTLRCYYLDMATKTVTEIDHAEYENVDVSLDRKPISDYDWSPDSRYLAYAKMDDDLVYKIYIYSLETGERRCVSNGLFNDFNPVFTRDGEHLLFISNRRFEPTYCDFEWEMVYKDVAGIYSLTLRKDGKPLLPFESDEESVDGKNAKKKNNKSKDQNSAVAPVIIDFAGIAERVEALPLSRGNYRDLAVNGTAVFYLNKDKGDFNRFEYRSIGRRDLFAFSFDDRDEKTVIKGIEGYRLSANGKHIIYKRRDALAIIGAGERDVEHREARDEEEAAWEEEYGEDEKSWESNELDLSEMTMWLDPRAEWTQMFHEAWRMERDFYYEPNMHGLDWPAMREKYGRLLPSASCRQDIRYLIGELIGELNTSHTYVWGGDRKRKADHIGAGLLGADWAIDSAANRYRFKKIYRVPDWTRKVWPPLVRPGVEVRVNDYLLRVNGREVTAGRNIYSYFQDLADKQVRLLINDQPTETNAREIVVKPLSSEYTLRYLDWVEHNRKVAEEASGGLIGYVHLPDTYTGSAREFPKYFYAQTQKKGLIVDGRFNGGGLDPDIFLQRLNKRLLTYWTRRYSHDQTTPFVVTRAHLACLTNRQAGSGGDMLPMEFQMHGMGPVIGTRTWGGLVGVSMWIGLVDGGGISAPDYRIYDPQGKWIVENEGVEPDIVVDLHPEEMARGYDAQLMKAIEYLMEQIEHDPRPWPEHEPYPVDR